MPDCNYCEESFADEEAYLDHLHEAHDEGELSRIDQRRVDSHVGDEGEGFPTGPVILGGLLLFTMALLIYVTFFVWGGNNTAASTHEHGLMTMRIDGERIDFSQRKYQLQDRGFHFEGGNGTVWHTHRANVTLGQAMSTLNISVEEDSVTFNGTTYADSDPGTNVSVTIDGESVDPASYVLDGVGPQADPSNGDHIRIIVRTNQSG